MEGRQCRVHQLQIRAIYSLRCVTDRALTPPTRPCSPISPPSYRIERHLIAAAANEADTARHTATDRHRAELTAVEKEITRTGTALDRYLTAFENNTLDPALLQDRLSALRAKTTQLQARRDELTELLDQAPAMPSEDELDALADHIDDILERGSRGATHSSSNSSKRFRSLDPPESGPSTASHATARVPNQPPTTAPRFAQWATWWAMLGSNQRPLRCERSALPLSQSPGPCSRPPCWRANTD
jgi:hypothetical protein